MQQPKVKREKKPIFLAIILTTGSAGLLVTGLVRKLVPGGLILAVPNKQNLKNNVTDYVIFIRNAHCCWTVLIHSRKINPSFYHASMRTAYYYSTTAISWVRS